MSYTYFIAGAPSGPGFQVPIVYNQCKVYLNGSLIADSGSGVHSGVPGSNSGTFVQFNANIGDVLRIQAIQNFPYDSGDPQSGAFLSQLSLVLLGQTRSQHLTSGFARRIDLPLGTFFDQEFVITLRPDPDPLEDERNKCDLCAWLRYLVSTGQMSVGAAELAYNSANSSNAPASLGWGWTMLGANKYVKTDSSNSDKIFYNGTTSFERWKLDGSGNYVPRFADNYDSLAINGSGQVVITTKEKWVLTFRASDGKISTEVDRNGNTITYNYDSLGRLSSKSDGEGRVLYVGYASSTDPNDLQPAYLREQNPATGRQTSFTYDGNGRLWKVTDPEGEVTQILYNAAGLLWKKIDPRGKTEVEYTYGSGKVATEKRYGELLLTYTSGVDGNGNPTTTIQEEDLSANTDSTVRTTVLTFDAFARPIKKVDPLGNVWTSTYADPLSPYLLTSRTDPNFNTTSYVYDNKGNMTSVTDAQGHVTTMTYTQGYLVASIQRPTVTVNTTPVTYNPSTMGYDTKGNLLTITDTLGGNPVVTTFVPGSDGRVLSITDRENKTTTFEYTTQSSGQNAGNLKKIILPSGPNSAPPRETVYSYNEYDERVKVTDPAGIDVSLMEFYNNGRLKRTTDALGKQVFFSYLGGGLLDYLDLPANEGSLTNARRTQKTYDDAGRALEVKSSVSTSVMQTRAKYVFDGRSNMKKLIRLKRDLSNNVVEKAHQFGFDVLDRPTSGLDPLGLTSQVEYDPFCKNFKTTSARGMKTFYSRDSLCRLTEVSSGTEIREFHYDELSRLVKVVQMPNGRPRYDDPLNLPTDRPASRYHQTKYTGNGALLETTYLYDELDRLVSVTYPGNQTVAYAYDKVGRVTSVTDMLANVTEYSYYNDGRLYQVKAKNSSGDQVFTYSYDLAGRPYEIAYPPSTGVVAKFYDASSNPGWDNNGRLTCLRYTKSGSLLQSFAYTYDDSGNRTSMVETPASGPAVTWSYHYDWLDRLTGVDKGGTPQSIYGYDESDNRIQLQLPVLGETHTYKYDFADRITSRLLNSSTVETFSHDNDGNMLARTSGGVTTSYTWDRFNKLASIIKSSFSASYTYDTDGVRKAKGTDTQYFSSASASLVDLKAANSTSFIQGDSIRGMRQGSNYYWYIPDGLGSVRLIVDSSGASVGTYSNDEFGRQTSLTGSVDRPHTYTGSLGVRNEVGSDSQLLYARQRWYDPQLGRWLSADPIGFSGGLNMYTYVDQNPVNKLDPTGTETAILVTGIPAGKITSIAGTEVTTYQAVVFKNGYYVGKFSVTRAPYDGQKADERYGSYSETPPGVYYLNKRPEDERIELSDKFGDRTINGPKGLRDYIQFHPAINAVGCLTFPNSSSGKWNDRQDGDDYWRLRDTILDDVESGRARVYLLGRHDDEGYSAIKRDYNIWTKFSANQATYWHSPWIMPKTKLRQ